MISTVEMPFRLSEGTKDTVILALWGEAPGSGGLLGSDVFSPIWTNTASTTVASGARIVLHLLEVLRRKGGGRGLATICIGGGQGGAMLVETV